MAWLIASLGYSSGDLWREAWCAAVHGVTKSWTQLGDWTTTRWNLGVRWLRKRHLEIIVECGSEEERGVWSLTQIWDAATHRKADRGARSYDIVSKNDHHQDVGGNIMPNWAKDRMIGLWEFMGMLLTHRSRQGGDRSPGPGHVGVRRGCSTGQLRSWKCLLGPRGKVLRVGHAARSEQVSKVKQQVQFPRISEVKEREGSPMKGQLGTKEAFSKYIYL